MFKFIKNKRLDNWEKILRGMGVLPKLKKKKNSRFYNEI